MQRGNHLSLEFAWVNPASHRVGSPASPGEPGMKVSSCVFMVLVRGVSLLKISLPCSVSVPSLSFPLCLSPPLSPLFIFLATKAVPTTEGNCILVHQFRFLRSRIWLAQPTYGPWPTLSNHLWLGCGVPAHRFSFWEVGVSRVCLKPYQLHMEIFTTQMHMWVTFSERRIQFRSPHN